MKLNKNTYKYVCNRLNTQKNTQILTEFKAIKELGEIAISVSDARIVFRDSRTVTPSVKFNDISEIIAKIPQRVRMEVAKYPKGTFRRTNTVYIEPLTQKKHTIVYEGIKVDFDITTEGFALPKVRTYIEK